MGIRLGIKLAHLDIGLMFKSLKNSDHPYQAMIFGEITEASPLQFLSCLPQELRATKLNIYSYTIAF